MKLYWAGWETDTYRLQQQGWRLSAQQDPMRGSIRLAIRHDELGIEGLTGSHGFDYRALIDARPIRAPIGLSFLARSIVIHEHEPFDFRPIDAQPQVSQGKISSLADLCHFPTPLVRTKALILPEATVDDLLSGILERQQDAKTAYFKDMVEREGEPMRAHKFHAQIISLAA